MDEALRRAEAIGLQGARMRPRQWFEQPCVEGSFGGRLLRLTHVSHRDGRFPAVVAPLLPALDLGLDVRPDPFSSAIGVAAIGHVHLDREYMFGADELPRARALFDGALANRVYQMHCACWSVRLSDATVTVSGGPDPVDWNRAGMRNAVELADLVDAARPRVPGPWRPVAHEDQWHALATRLGAQLQRTPLRMSGQLDDLTLQAQMVRTATSTHQLELDLRRDKALQAKLRVTPARPILDRAAVLLGGQDIELGDAPFDGAFRVRVGDAYVGALRGALDASTRALVMGVRARGATIHLDDQGVVATFGGGAEPHALPSSVEPLIEVLRRLGRALRLDASASPYR